jgi:hypothetical protein
MKTPNYSTCQVQYLHNPPRHRKSRLEPVQVPSQNMTCASSYSVDCRHSVIGETKAAVGNSKDAFLTQPIIISLGTLFTILIGCIFCHGISRFESRTVLSGDFATKPLFKPGNAL